MRPRILLNLVLLIPAIAVCGSSQYNVAIAYLDGQQIVLADSSGLVRRVVPIPFKKEVSGVAVNATGTALVATVRGFGRGEFGGDFYLWTLESKRWVQITSGPYVFKENEIGHREVYDNPSFSPDGKYIAFAIHTESLYNDNDVAMAAGPAAVMDLGTRKVSVIKSTGGDPDHDPGGAPWFANSPQWSPDGKRLLLDFEVGFATIDLATGLLHRCDPPTAENTASRGINWLDSERVVFLVFFEVGKSPAAYTLKLSDGAVTNAPVRFTSTPGVLEGFNSEISVVDNLGMLEVRGPKAWNLRKPSIYGLAPSY